MAEARRVEAGKEAQVDTGVANVEEAEKAAAT
jgi:hypothetical protein